MHYTLQLREVNQPAWGLERLTNLCEGQRRKWDSGLLICTSPNPDRSSPHTQLGHEPSAGMQEAWVRTPAESLGDCGVLVVNPSSPGFHQETGDEPHTDPRGKTGSSGTLLAHSKYYYCQWRSPLSSLM